MLKIISPLISEKGNPTMNKLINHNENHFENLAFFNNNEALEWLQKKSQDYIKLMSYYKCAMMEIETKINVLNEEYSLEFERNPISSIKTRLKHPKSVKEKLEKQNLPKTLESIETHLHDVAGVRVICNFIDDVYTIADALLKQDDITLIEIKDYIKNPKANGYRSLHLIISIPIFLAHEKREMKVEIQLRTIAMDFWASIEHQMRYKKNFVFTQEMENELYECAALSAELDLRMSKLHDVSKLIIQERDNIF